MAVLKGSSCRRWTHLGWYHFNSFSRKLASTSKHHSSTQQVVQITHAQRRLAGIKNAARSKKSKLKFSLLNWDLNTSSTNLECNTSDEHAPFKLLHLETQSVIDSDNPSKCVSSDCDQDPSSLGRVPSWFAVALQNPSASDVSWNLMKTRPKGLRIRIPGGLLYPRIARRWLEVDLRNYKTISYISICCGPFELGGFINTGLILNIRVWKIWIFPKVERSIFATSTRPGQPRPKSCS